MKMPKNFRTTARITGEDKQFLKDHNITSSDAIAKYCEIMRNHDERLLAEKRLLELEQTQLDSRAYEINNRLNEINEVWKLRNKSKQETLEADLISKMASVLVNNGYCINNHNEAIFNKPNVQDCMFKYSNQSNLDYDTFKERVIDYVIHQ